MNKAFLKKCKERIVYDNASPNGFAMGNMDGTDRTCSRSVWKDGYCKQHHPDTVKEKERKNHEKWKIEHERSPFTRLPIVEKELAEWKNKYKLLLCSYIDGLELLKVFWQDADMERAKGVGAKIDELKKEMDEIQ